MWRCLIFMESFKRGKRVVNRDQTVQIIVKLCELAERMPIPPISGEKEVILLDSEVKIHQAVEKQNLFQKIFIPSLSSINSDFEKDISGIIFVEIDPILERHLSQICLESKKIIKNFQVSDAEVQKIINSVNTKDVKRALSVGDVIEILDGSYKSMIGRIQRILENDRFSINIQIFGVDQSIELAADQIKIAEDS
jgi:transcription antitermination factor NusG